ncbi:hypothetical protein AB0L25_38915 [Spirillospora sp. NPDC052242]
MIGKVLRGKRAQGLLRYLYGPGRHGEHQNPRIVAGFRSPAELEPGHREDGRRDFSQLDGLLMQPVAQLGERSFGKPVWHLSLRAAPDDPVLSDRQWAQIADEVMVRTGLGADGDADGVRWIAVRHADDHIHIVATLARADGVRPNVWNDGYRVREACRAVERRFGLRSTAPADRTAARRPKRAESEKAVRRGRKEPPRTVLRRKVQTAAAGAADEHAFFARLSSDGLLVRRRYSRRTSGEITGYSVALPDDRNADGGPVWYGGGKLAADLTLPKLRRRWTADEFRRHLSAPSARAVLRTAVRRAADDARTAHQFADALRRNGLLVKLRHSQRSPEQITGYAVALPAQDKEEVTWYPGSRLAEDLSLTRLRARWDAPNVPRRAPLVDLTPEERRALYEDAAKAAAYATAQVRRHLVTNPYAAQDACWAAADALHTAATATGNRQLRRAAHAYDRAARAPHGRVPRPSPAGNALRAAARLLRLAGSPKDDLAVSVMTLMANLHSLLETIAHVRRLQQHQAQAEAARAAARHLRDLRSTPASAQAMLALTGFPDPWRPPEAGGPRRSPPKPASPATRRRAPGR